jgi:hypothetical protein
MKANLQIQTHTTTSMTVNQMFQFMDANVKSGKIDPRKLFLWPSNEGGVRELNQREVEKLK